MKDRRYDPMSETMFLILFALREERHGYGIMQHVEDLTGGRVSLGAGTVYMSLGKLRSDNLIKETASDGRKTNYLITPKGTEILRREARRIADLYTYAKEIS
jgi:DNA-binding PadR family transcriptional regulator